MATTNRATWRYLTAVLLLATMPAQASLAPLPPKSFEPAGLIADEVLEELRAPQTEDLVLVVELLLVLQMPPGDPVCRAEPVLGEAGLEPKSRVGVFDLIQQEQRQWNQSFNPRIVVGVTVASYAYTLGEAGNRTGITEQDGTVRSYGYDSLYRLVSESVTDGLGAAVYSKGFGYDPVGNRLSQDHTEGATTTTGYNYDDRDRLTLEGSASYTWDDSGRLTDKAGEASYTWDLEDRLTRVELTDGTVVVHVYDADGVRVRTTTTPNGGVPEVVDYLNDKTGLSQVVVETDGAGDLAAVYVRGDDLLAVIRGTVGRFYHADGLGSVRALTDEMGTVTDRWSYTAFGEPLSHTGTDPNVYLFAGERLDPSSAFYYLRARWMDSSIGRLVAVDQFRGVLTDPRTLHAYQYAASSPLTFVDPTGRNFTLPSLLLVLAMSVLLVNCGGSTLGVADPPEFAVLGEEVVKDPSRGFFKDFWLQIGTKDAGQQSRYLVVQWVRGFMTVDGEYAHTRMHGERVPTNFPDWIIDSREGGTVQPSHLAFSPDGLIHHDGPGVNLEHGSSIKSGSFYRMSVDFMVNVYDRRLTRDSISAFKNPWSPRPLARHEWSFHDSWQAP